MQHMTYRQIIRLSTEQLRTLIASTRPDGVFANEVKWATEELKLREIAGDA